MDILKMSNSKKIAKRFFTNFFHFFYIKLFITLNANIFKNASFTTFR